MDYFSSDYDVSYDDDLTEDDIKYLRLSWGKTYNSEELIKLEKLYREMEESFDIQNAGHRDTLRKVCKTSLKTDQLLDIGDVDGAQKMSRMYEALMKAGKFTAVQNKTEQGECLDSISELVIMCEKEGFIPRFYIDKPNDKVDETIADMKDYVQDLFSGESNLDSMIEMAVRQIHEQESREEDEDIDDDEIAFEEIETMVKDEDFIDFNAFIEENQEMSEEAIKIFERRRIMALDDILANYSKTEMSPSLLKLLGVDDNVKKIGLSEERVAEIVPVARTYISYWREYPDLFID